MSTVSCKEVTAFINTQIDELKKTNPTIKPIEELDEIPLPIAETILKNNETKYQVKLHSKAKTAALVFGILAVIFFAIMFPFFSSTTDPRYKRLDTGIFETIGYITGAAGVILLVIAGIFYLSARKQSKYIADRLGSKPVVWLSLLVLDAVITLKRQFKHKLLRPSEEFIEIRLVMAIETVARKFNKKRI